MERDGRRARRKRNTNERRDRREDGDSERGQSGGLGENGVLSTAAVNLSKHIHDLDSLPLPRSLSLMNV